MMRTALLMALVLLAVPSVAAAQSADPRSAIIARAQAAIVEVRIAPEPPPPLAKRVMRLSEGECAERNGTWLGDRRCEVADFPLPWQPRPPERSAAGQMGSGFVVDAPRGLILTANHIIGTGREPKVKLADGRLLSATLAGRDEPTGLALLRIEAQGLTALPLATRPPVAGEASLLVGRLLPFDSIIATSGMVGGRIPAEGDGANLGWLADNWMIDNLLPGGGLGGGPVLNSAGEVIGLATAIYGRDGYGQGAATIMIALDGARPLIELLVTKGAVERSQIGVAQDCRDGICRIDAAFLGGPAQRAGLQAEDQIRSIDGQPFTTANAISRYIASRPVGSVLRFEIARADAPVMIDVTTISSLTDLTPN